MSSASVPFAVLGRAVAHLLVIAPDPEVRNPLVHHLAREGYPTSAESDTDAGLATAARDRSDLVLLAGRFAAPDTLRAVCRLRATAPGSAVMVVTCEADEPSVVAALDAGADDWVVRPAGVDSLMARIRAVLRRCGGEQSAPRSMLRLGGLHLDLAARRAELDELPLALSPREFDLLAYLAQRVGQVVTKTELLAEVWRQPGLADKAASAGGTAIAGKSSVADKTVDVHVSWLRRKLRESAQAPRYLHTVRGVGLRFDVPRS